jgi:hypothetical protein
MTKQQTKELPEIAEFYVNSSLYTEYKAEEEDKENIFNTVFNMNPIDCYCIDCSANSVFKPYDNRLRSDKGGFNFPITYFNEWNINLSLTETVLQKEYTCSRNPQHKLIFFLQLKNGKISKIGQSPALADISEQEIRKYKKILGDSNYHEFSKAIGLFAHGVGVGSFVYLRRIIENFIIKPAYEKSKIKPGWNESTYQKSRVKEKIELLNHELPEFLVNNAVIYSIISKGIHELTENECKEYFPVIKTCLEFVLTDLEAKRETELKRKEMQTTLGKIAGEIK